MVVMTSVEDGILLKLKGMPTCAHNFAYHAHQNEDTLSSSLLWHAIFGHLNYENIRLLKNNGASGLPTIPRKLQQSDACILGKHSKQSLYDSTSSACRKLGLIHSDLCGPMHVQSTNGNKYIMSFIDEYTSMCWVYLLKNKSKDCETFKNFHVCIKNKHKQR